MHFAYALPAQLTKTQLIICTDSILRGTAPFGHPYWAMHDGTVCLLYFTL